MHTVFTGQRRLPIWAVAAASVGVAVAQLTAAILTLPLVVARVAPDAQSATLSFVIGSGAVVGLVALPLMGMASDRTRGILGRRRPWLIGGVVAIMGGAVGLAAASDVPIVALSWWCASSGVAAITVATSAAVTDQVPAESRGPASAAVGLGQPIGVLLGLVIAQFVAHSPVALALVPAALGSVGILTLAVSMADPASTGRAPRGRSITPRALLAPFADRDFRWVWVCRLLLASPIAAFAAYAVYFLTVRLGVPGEQIAASMLALWTVLGVTTLAVAALSARLSDRFRRRKVFVTLGGSFIASGFVVATMAGDMVTLCLAMLLAGAGQGMYVSVELAVVSEILPDGANPAGALGIANLASNLPGVLIPVVAPAILMLGTGASDGYGSLFLVAAGLAALGVLAILPVRGIR